MRTIDPELWSNKVKGRKMDLARPLRFELRRSGLGARLRSCSYSDAMGEFWTNVSAPGFRNLACKDAGKRERYYWRLLLVICISCTLLVLVLTVLQFVRVQSLQLSHTSLQHSVNHIQFPAVALCSYNVISKRALDSFVKEIMHMAEYRSHSQETLRKSLLQFGRLQTMALQTPAVPQQELQIAHSLRNITSRHGFSVEKNVTDLMFRLAPPCDSMLMKCAWRGKEMPCDLLFAPRLTSVGYCCVFNSRYEPYDLKNPPRKVDRVGQDNGLSVIHREDVNDFALLRRPVYGTEVLIFDGSEYPLLEGGAVRVQRAHLNASVFFKLNTRTQLAISILNLFPDSLRGCRMKSAGSSRQLSYSACLLECRRRAVKDLCGCVPYTLQPRNGTVCSLDHLLCLKRHREMFLYYFPSDAWQLELREESANALFCPHCQPDCARALHSVVGSRVAYNHPHKTFRNTFTAGVKNFANTSVLRFYYPKVGQHLYTLEPNKVWFERIASLSSQWVSLLGLSLVTLFELIFHCTVRWRHHYVRRKTLYTNA